MNARPEDIPQDVWDVAEIAAKEATRDAMRDPLMPYYITVAPYIARAIMAAKAEEREACAQIAERKGEWHIKANATGLPVELSEVVAKDRAKIAFAIRDAIRKRGGE